MDPHFRDRRYLIPFRSSLLPQIFCDTLIVGTGVAGLRSSLSAAEYGNVIVLSKGNINMSCSSLAQGGVAAAVGADDDINAHMQDTLKAGAGLCDHAPVHRLVRGATARIEELAKWGMPFDRTESGDFALGREGAHQKSRVLHADGDGTGDVLVRCLGRRARHTESIRIFEECFAIDLLTAESQTEDPRIIGVLTYHPRYGLQIIRSHTTILASGGAGRVYRETTNPDSATGDGLAMACRAGLRIADMAFIQFHPTTLYIAGSARTLISEAVRGEGAYLIDRNGKRFMVGAHEMAELAPRDVVSRAIRHHVSDTGQTHVFLDTRHFEAGFFAKRFPGIYKQLQLFGIDPEHDPIPVHPSAHYTIGGIWTDGGVRTGLSGLYACGEVACTGIHGANRLASNSLLEGLVFGEEAGRLAGEEAQKRSIANGYPAIREIVSTIPESQRGTLDLVDVLSSLRSVMLRHVGTERNGANLADVREMIDFWARYTLDKVCEEPAGWEIQNLIWVASMICNSALWREESRGTHARSDFPEELPQGAVHDIWDRFAAKPVTQPVGIDSIENTT